MNTLIAGIFGLVVGASTAAVAQTNEVPAPSDGQAVERVERSPPAAMQNAPSEIQPQPGANTGSLPLEGANSFTEAQAKQLVQDAGYTGISTLTKDQRGVWRGSAMKAGKSASIAVDFKGNVVQVN